MQRALLLLAFGLALVLAQPFQPGQNLAPLGNLRTSDFGGPYNLSLLNVQEAEVKSKQHDTSNIGFMPHASKT